MAFLLLLFAMAEVLTNDDVVKMSQAGLTPPTIETKIYATQVQFDTSTDALVALAKAGVPDVVIRAMIARQSQMAAPTPPTPPAPPAPVAAPAAPAPPAAPSVVRRFDVSVHRNETDRCDGGELRLDSKGVKTSRCRGVDFELAWDNIRSICYDYSFRGVVAFNTTRREYRVSTQTPAAARKIVEAIRDMRPVLTTRDSCQ